MRRSGVRLPKAAPQRTSGFLTGPRTRAFRRAVPLLTRPTAQLPSAALPPSSPGPRRGCKPRSCGRRSGRGCVASRGRGRPAPVAGSRQCLVRRAGALAERRRAATARLTRPQSTRGSMGRPFGWQNTRSKSTQANPGVSLLRRRICLYRIKVPPPGGARQATPAPPPYSLYLRPGVPCYPAPLPSITGVIPSVGSAVISGTTTIWWASS
jgi:hypothetical protein